MLLYLLLSCCLARLTFAQASGSCQAITQHLPDPPYDDYFYSDCHVDAQAVVTSPLSNSDLTQIGPRLIVAWPAGNSGICTYFAPQNGQNGTLAISLVNSTIGLPLAPVYQLPQGQKNPTVGVQGVLSFNTSAELTIPILGSVRTIRDFTEGPSLLRPMIQDAINVTQLNKTGASFSRLWLDNVTTTTFTLMPFENTQEIIQVNPKNRTINFGSGFYTFTATFDYPQLQQLPATQLFNNQSQSLIKQENAQTTSLQFLSYSNKLLAGAWRFLTYFGRDSMIASLLLEPVLSSGNGSALEAVLGAVLERINRTDGSVCHEETIGDYATWANLQNNITSTAPGYTYPMIDTDFYLPILMASYFTSFPARIQPFLSTKAGSINPANLNLTYADLALLNSQKIMNETAAFSSPNNQTLQNLVHLKTDQIVGQWRDSTYGIGGGRIPFDCNTALAPAALRAISSLASMHGVYPNSSNTSTWPTLASTHASYFENSTLQFFEHNLTSSTVSNNLQQFVSNSTFYSGPTHSNLVNTTTGNLTTYAISLDGYNNLSSVNVLHSDTSFHLFLVNTSSAAHTRLLNSTALSILNPFPLGLLTPSGMVVANPALSGSTVLNANYTNGAYHGTVIWSFQMALMAKGFERQLSRCNTTNSSFPAPMFCNDTIVYKNVRAAYNTLWDSIEANSAQLQSEVWSWTYSNSTGFVTTPLGELPVPPGVGGSQTESDVRQLWSLTFLAVTRDEAWR